MSVRGGAAGIVAGDGDEDKGKRVLIIERGKDVEERSCPVEEFGSCINCAQCNVMCGVGGAGTFSDGTLNIRPDIGGDLTEFCDYKTAWQLVDEVDRVFLKHGMPDKLYKGNAEDVEELKRRAASVGASFVEINQRHIGSDKTKKVIKSFKNDLTEHGIEFMLNTRVADFIMDEEEGEEGVTVKVCRGVITDKGDEIRSECTIVAPGRIGASWIEQMLKKHGIEAEYAGIDVGVRVEVLAITMNPVTKINRDPKFHIRTKRYDDFARTFCTNERGFIVKEVYDDFIGVNGHSMKTKKSENTNFAFLVRVELTKPVENTTR